MPDRAVDPVASEAHAREFAEFYSSHVDTLRGVLRRSCGDLADDIAQDAFVAALEMWPSLTEMDSPSGWLWVTARRMAWRQSSRNTARLFKESETAYSADQIDCLPDTDTRDGVSSLPEPQRSAVLLRYFLDLPVEEISLLLGCTTATAKVWLHRARGSLRRMLSPVDGTWVGRLAWTEDLVVARAREIGAISHIETLLQQNQPTRERIFHFEQGRFKFTSYEGDLLDFGSYEFKDGRLTLDTGYCPGQLSLGITFDAGEMRLRYSSHTTTPHLGISDEIWAPIVFEPDTFVWSGR